MYHDLLSDLCSTCTRHCHGRCGQPGSGAVTLLAVNPTDAPMSVTVSGVASTTPRLEYVFTAADNNFNSTTPVLNGGAALRIGLDGSLPAMVGVAARGVACVGGPAVVVGVRVGSVTWQGVGRIVPVVARRGTCLPFDYGIIGMGVSVCMAVCVIVFCVRVRVCVCFCECLCCVCVLLRCAGVCAGPRDRAQHWQRDHHRACVLAVVLCAAVCGGGCVRVAARSSKWRAGVSTMLELCMHVCLCLCVCVLVVANVRTCVRSSNVNHKVCFCGGSPGHTKAWLLPLPHVCVWRGGGGLLTPDTCCQLTCGR